MQHVCPLTVIVSREGKFADARKRKRAMAGVISLSRQERMDAEHNAETNSA
jgi:hypothetical protein